jgi:hypothetical protein
MSKLIKSHTIPKGGKSQPEDAVLTNMVGLIGSALLTGDIEYQQAKASYKHACMNCGAGGMFIGSLPISAARMPKAEIMETYESDWLCSAKVAKRLVDKYGVDTEDLIPVQMGRKTSVDLFLIQPSCIIGPMEHQYSHMDISKSCWCTVCGRRGYFNDPSHVYVYKSKTFAHVKKVPWCRTWECIAKEERLPMNLSGDNDFPRSYLLVDRAIGEFLQSVSSKRLKLQSVFTV